MLAFLHRILDWFKNVFWKEEMELALVGLQNSGKTTFVNVISVRSRPTRFDHTTKQSKAKAKQKKKAQAEASMPSKLNRT